MLWFIALRSESNFANKDRGPQLSNRVGPPTFSNATAQYTRVCGSQSSLNAVTVDHADNRTLIVRRCHFTESSMSARTLHVNVSYTTSLTMLLKNYTDSEGNNFPRQPNF